VRRREALLEAIGRRARLRREAAGLTQRELAERSGLSPRYIAQLEAGEANLSVERLTDVADALGTTAATLLAGSEPHAPPPTTAREAGRAETRARLRAEIDVLLDARDATELVEVRRWLEARFAQRTAPVIALVGLRGAGKSTIGPRLAKRLKLAFVELDQRIEEAAGMRLGELFALHGEAYYRRLERETLMALLAEPGGVVVATGGSIVNDRETFRLLRRRAVTVWLRARPEDHWNRVVAQGDRRPMAEHPHAMDELRALLAARERHYAEAEHVIDTWRYSIDGVVDTLATELGAPA
jgi:XRE family aerobic/anaerobic benzoate catabolism transcriptional regulator